MRFATAYRTHVHADAAGQPGGHRPRPERQHIESMFDSIAFRYDFLNRILSAGFDTGWRRQAVRSLQAMGPRLVLDVATGTADMAIAAARRCPAGIVGIDISTEMLERASEKIERAGFEDRIVLRQGTAEALPFDRGSFDAAVVGFGVRNFADPARGLAELARVLRPGGIAIILEFSRPRGRILGPLYRFYARRILPRIGGIISGNREAYEYLPRTAAAFPDGRDFAALLRDAGFASAAWEEVTGGICTIYHATK